MSFQRFAVVLSLAFVLSAGCGRPSATTITGDDGEKITVAKKRDGEEIVFKNRDGAEVRYAGGKTAVALPEGFPNDIAVYPKATIAMSAVEGNTMTVILNTADAAEKAEAFYKESLEKNGWKILQSMTAGQGSILIAQKSGRKTTLAILAEAETTVIQISVVKE